PRRSATVRGDRWSAGCSSRPCRSLAWHRKLEGNRGRYSMNNLHRKLAPISDAAWADIEAEARRTFTRHVAARRVVDVIGPGGEALAAVGTGHLKELESPAPGVRARSRI